MKSNPIKPTIDIKDLSKIDARIGTITKVEDIPESDKLVKLAVDFGDFTRQIVVGLKQERENPSEIEGLQALFVVNLEPRKIMGHESQGMLYDIGYENDITPVLAVPEKSVPNGAQAG